MSDLLQAGTTFQNYVITRLIGRGGMGEVYEAVEQGINRRVALKVMPSEVSGTDPEGAQRFLREAQTLARVSHPNVVNLYNLGQHENFHFIAMEYIEGISLRDLLDKYLLSHKDACTLAVQILNGLSAFHALNIIHRDVSPRNIIVRPNGHIKIIDLGIAKEMGQRDLTATGMMIGTLSYMAPEVVYGLPATNRADIWATGAIIFEATSGQTLTSNQNALHSAEYPKECQGWVPGPFRAVVARMCASKPENRFSSAEEAIQEFTKLAGGNLEPGVASLALLARTIDNLEAATDSLTKSSVTGLTLKRALTIAAQMSTGKTIQGPSAVGDRTEVIKVDHTVRIEAKAIEAAIAQVRKSSMIPSVQQTQLHPQFAPLVPVRKMNLTVPLVVLAIVAGSGFVYWKKQKEIAAKQAALAAEAAQKAARAAIKYSSTTAKLFWLKPGEPITLTWTPALAAPAQIEIASNANFTDVVRYPAQGSSTQLPQGRPEGPHFWRITGADFSAGPFEFNVNAIAPLELLTPVAGSKIPIESTATSVNSDFTWKCKPGANIYRAQLSRNMSFTDVINESQTRACEWKGVPLEVGQFYWRVRVDQPIEAQIWTDGREITVEREIKPVVAAVQEPVKSERANKMLDNLAVGSGGARPVEPARAPAATEAPIKTPTPGAPASGARFSRTDPVQVTWDNIDGARAYTLEVSADEQFTTPTTRRTSTPGFQFHYKSLKAERVFWRVRSEGKTISNWSEVRQFGFD